MVHHIDILGKKTKYEISILSSDFRYFWSVALNMWKSTELQSTVATLKCQIQVY